MMKTRTIWGRLVLGWIAALCFSHLLYSQAGVNGTLLGTVTDTAGALVPQADVTAINKRTGVTVQAHVTSAGDFVVPYLAPGVYRLEVRSAGFETAVRDDLTLNVGQQLRVNVSLKPGSATETVVVQSSTVNLDTDSAAVSHVVGERQVQSLPLANREFAQLLFIGQGAVQLGGEQDSTGDIGAVSINGSRPESNNYMLDGMVDQEQVFNSIALPISVEAVQEFQTLTETYSAQFGFSANQINIITKSGTNQFHGSAFEFNRNDALDAIYYFTPPGSPKGELRQNQFGYSLGGPVWIPKVYNGQNKTFFFTNYEGWRVINGSSSAQTFVPPLPGLLKGEFTDSVDDPVAKAPFPGCTDNGTTYVSCIPASRWSRLATLAINDHFFPAPNIPNQPIGAYNFAAAPKLPVDTDQQTYRIDQELGKWGKVFGRGSFSSQSQGSFGYVPTSGVIGGQTAVVDNTNWAVAHTVSIRPNLLNQFSLGRLTYSKASHGYPATAAQIAQLNYANTYPNIVGIAQLPNISFKNNAGQIPEGTFGGAINQPGTQGTNLWQFIDSIAWIHGAHTMTFGGDYKRWQTPTNGTGNLLGFEIYAEYATGDQWGDFLLGAYENTQASTPGPGHVGPPGNFSQYNSQYFASFFQDDWKVTPKLTLNLGLRWDLRGIPDEIHEHEAWLNTSFAGGGLCVPDPTLYTNGIAGTTGFYTNCGESPKAAEKKNFSPRVGFAWRPLGDKTVLRGGYGLYWDGIEQQEFQGATGIYPYNIGLNLLQQGGQATYATTDQLFPTLPAGAVIPGPSGQVGFVALPLPAGAYFKNPYIQQYTLGAQRSLPHNTVLEVSYIGNRGTHLLTRVSINQAYPLSPADAATCQQQIEAKEPLTGNCPVSARQPYANFGTYLDSRFQSYSNYNAGNIKIDHKSTNLALSSAYTWSKSLDDKSAAASIGGSPAGWEGYLNNHDPKMDYGRSDFDVGQRFVASAVYDLPVGRGKAVLSHANTFVDDVIGHWQGTAVYLYQGGFPMAITAGDPNGLLNNNNVNRADIHGPIKMLKKRNQWFDTSSFSDPAPNTFGNSGRNIIRMPGINNWDISVLKDIPIWERVRFQFRAETFNTFNHPQFWPDPSRSAFGGGGVTVGNSVDTPGTFGVITGGAQARQIQLGAKVLF